jgi:hypothetical protein
MRVVQEIYAAYRIMPSLQLHQLRVASAGKMICDHFSGPLDPHAVILACLFHDMGNIIKSDLTTFPEFVEPEGYDYWKKIKDEWHAKYGDDEHAATIEIAKEIGVNRSAVALMEGVGFSKIENTRDSGSYEQKIVEYADSRIGPYGVLSLEDRHEEAYRRYSTRQHHDIPKVRERFDELASAAREIEKQVFARCSIKPENINDESVAPLVEELRNYPIE